MAMLGFDTHAVFKDLHAAGFTEQQAEVLTRTVRQAQEAFLADLPTKADHAVLRNDIETLRLSTETNIEALRASTKSDIEALRASTRSDIEAARLSTEARIANLKVELVRWVVGAVSAQFIALAALARIFFT